MASRALTRPHHLKRLFYTMDGLVPHFCCGCNLGASVVKQKDSFPLRQPYSGRHTAEQLSEMPLSGASSRSNILPVCKYSFSINIVGPYIVLRKILAQVSRTRRIPTPFMVKVGITAAHAQQSLALTQCSVHDCSLWRVSMGRRGKSVGGEGRRFGALARPTGRPVGIE